MNPFKNILSYMRFHYVFSLNNVAIYKFYGRPHDRDYYITVYWDECISLYYDEVKTDNRIIFNEEFENDYALYNEIKKHIKLMR